MSPSCIARLGCAGQQLPAGWEWLPDPEVSLFAASNLPRLDMNFHFAPDAKLDSGGWDAWHGWGKLDSGGWGARHGCGWAHAAPTARHAWRGLAATPEPAAAAASCACLAARHGGLLVSRCSAQRSPPGAPLQPSCRPLQPHLDAAGQPAARLCGAHGQREGRTHAAGQAAMRDCPGAGAAQHR